MLASDWGNSHAEAQRMQSYFFVRVARRRRYALRAWRKNTAISLFPEPTSPLLSPRSLSLVSSTLSCDGGVLSVYSAPLREFASASRPISLFPIQSLFTITPCYAYVASLYTPVRDKEQLLLRSLL